VRISMTDRDVVERAGALVDRAVIAVRPRLSHHKTPYITCMKGAPAVALMRAVQLQMGCLRKVQIERAIASWHGHRTRWRRRAAHCSVAECPRSGTRRGLCKRHYDRWWKAQRRGETTDFGPLDPPAAYHPIRLVDPPATCVVPQCSDPHRGRGLCHKHYMMWSRDKTKGREARIAPLR
jgi:hypothetical protein